MRAVLLLLIFLSTILYADQKLKVTRSEPVFTEIYESVEMKDCYPESYYERGGADALETLLGASVGALIGNQFGQAEGKTAATIGGAIVGGALTSSKKQKVVVDRCQTKVVQMPKTVIAGYQNYADYNGVEISRFSKEPLEFIEIKSGN